MSGATRQCNLECRSVGSALRKHGIGKKIGAIDCEGVHAEEIDFLGNIVGPERAMPDFFSAGPDNDGMKFVLAANRARNQTSPVYRHSVGGLRLHDPEWRLVGEI